MNREPLNRRQILPVLVTLALLLGGLAVVGWWIQRLNATVERLRVDAAELSQRVENAEERANAAELRAATAETQASSERERASQAEEEAQLAEQQRADAIDARLAAETESDLARATAVEAREREAAALAEATAAYESATAAQEEARVAREEYEKLRLERERELNRLESALGKLAETRRTALGLVLNLGDSIEFDFDRSELRPENRELLARIAGVLMTADDYHLQVFGHTDDVGDASYNQRLSEERASSVLDYLVKSGVDPNIISADGLGNTQPLVEGTSEAARQRNRRVEIALISYQESFVPVQ